MPPFVSNSRRCLLPHRQGDRRGDTLLDDEDRQTFLYLLAKEIRQPAPSRSKDGVARRSAGIWRYAETLQSRSHLPAFWAWVYVPRRVSNLSLRLAGSARASRPAGFRRFNE